MDGDGDTICNVSASAGDCRLTGPTPYRVLAWTGTDPRSAVAASYQLDLRDVTAGQGCTSVADAGWGAALPVSATRGDEAAECFTVSTGAGGLHLLRLRAANTGWSMQVQVYDQDGLAVGYAVNGYASFPDLPAGETYRVLVSGDTRDLPGGYRLGWFDAASSGCAPVASTGWDAAGQSGSFPQGGELHCRELPEPGRLSHPGRDADNLGYQTTSTTSSTTPQAARCVPSPVIRPADCRLVGTAPFRLVTRLSGGSSAPGTYQVWINDTASTDRCTSMVAGAWGTRTACLLDPRLGRPGLLQGHDDGRRITAPSLHTDVEPLDGPPRGLRRRGAQPVTGGGNIDPERTSHPAPTVSIVSGDPNGQPAGFKLGVLAA